MRHKVEKILRNIPDIKCVTWNAGIFRYNYIYIPASGIIYHRSLRGGHFAINHYRKQKTIWKYVKIVSVAMSLMIKFLKERYVFLNIKNDRVIFFLFGKGSRVKAFVGSEIENYFFNNDRFSKTDIFMRRKLAKLNISPKLLESSPNYYKERYINTIPYTNVDLSLQKEKLLVPFYSNHKTLIMDSLSYSDKIISRIYKYSKIKPLKPLSKPKEIKICMSHGDFHPGNVMQDKSGSIFLIDFEYSRYRSKKYDEIFWIYRAKCVHDLSGLDFSSTDIYIFCLERLELILSLQHYLKKNYSNEIDLLHAYLTNTRTY